METEIAAVAAASALDPPPDARDTPLVALNMVMSADGRISVGDRVRGLTGSADQALLHHLRAQSDVVLVGASTVRAEGYGGLLPDELKRTREEAGRTAEPLLCIASASLDLDPSLGAFNAPGLEVLVTGPTSIASLLRRLRDEHDARVVVCEGGPALAAAVAEADCLDYAFVTISPHFVGGLGRSGLTSDALAAVQDLELESARAVGDHVFLRYRVGR